MLTLARVRQAKLKFRTIGKFKMSSTARPSPTHVLVTNDDGPPGQEAPFLAPFLMEWEKSLATWRRSVCVPATQQSWIGKAIFRKEVATVAYVEMDKEHGTLTKTTEETETSLACITGTPATCVNIACFHPVLPKQLPDPQKIDLVVSGPNFGRNTGRAFMLSSGTVGGAMEGVMCDKKAIALSFAFFRGRDVEEKDVKVACVLACRVIQQLWEQWPEDVDLFNINIPLGVDENAPIRTVPIAERKLGQMYARMETDDTTLSFEHKLMNWKTVNDKNVVKFGTDAWAINHGVVSITPMKANFAQIVEAGLGIYPSPTDQDKELTELTNPAKEFPVPVPSL